MFFVLANAESFLADIILGRRLRLGLLNILMVSRGTLVLLTKLCFPKIITLKPCLPMWLYLEVELLEVIRSQGPCPCDGISALIEEIGASQVELVVKNPNLPDNAGAPGDTGLISGLERSLEEGMATHSSILTWRIPWTEEPGGLQSIELKRGRKRLKWLSTHAHKKRFKREKSCLSLPHKKPSTSQEEGFH